MKTFSKRSVLEPRLDQLSQSEKHIAHEFIFDLIPASKLSSMSDNLSSVKTVKLLYELTTFFAGFAGSLADNAEDRININIGTRTSRILFRYLILFTSW